MEQILKKILSTRFCDWQHMGDVVLGHFSILAFMDVNGFSLGFFVQVEHLKGIVAVRNFDWEETRAVEEIEKELVVLDRKVSIYVQKGTETGI